MIYGNKFLNEAIKIIGKSKYGYDKTDKKINGCNIILGSTVKKEDIEENLLALAKSFSVANQEYKKAFNKFIEWLDNDPNYPDVTSEQIIKGTSLYEINFHIGNVKIDALKIPQGRYYEYEFCFKSGKGTDAKKVYDAAAFIMYIDENLKLQKLEFYDV